MMSLNLLFAKNILILYCHDCGIQKYNSNFGAGFWRNKKMDLWIPRTLTYQNKIKLFFVNRRSKKGIVGWFVEH